MKTRRRPGIASLLAALPPSLRRTAAGVALGVWIGAVGVLTLFPERQPSDEQQQLGEIRSHEALRYGAPSTANVLVRSGYVASYDYRTRNPAWVIEKLTKESLAAADEADRAKSAFKPDSETPDAFRVHPNQFLKSGYDKGHLAPARDMSRSQTAMDESFLMTNISPQVGVGFNRGYWSRLEGFVRHLAHQYDAVYVVTGPLYLPKKDKKTGEYVVSYPVIGTPPDAIAVPTHFFKVILAEGRGGNTFVTAGFILPNRQIAEKKELRDFEAPLDVIEKYAGLVFFDKLRHIRKRDLCSETKCSLAPAYWRSIEANTETTKVAVKNN